MINYMYNKYENHFQIQRTDYMIINDSYNTKQKELILEEIKKQKGEFTIKDIYTNLKNKTGLTTVYRFVDKLFKDEKLNKFIGNDNITYYEYLEDCSESNHFYLKCIYCKKLIHIDCDCITELSNHILKKHKFRPSKEHIIINGICQECFNEGE